VFSHLFGRYTQAGVDLSGGPINVGKSLGRKEVVKVFGVRKVMLQNIRDVLVNAAEAGLGRSTLGLLVELIIKLNLVHGSRLLGSPLYIKTSVNPCHHESCL